LREIEQARAFAATLAAFESRMAEMDELRELTEKEINKRRALEKRRTCSSPRAWCAWWTCPPSWGS
jgi:hypothetical protein